MDVTKLLPKDKSYWVAAIVAVLAFGLLIVTSNLSVSSEEKSLSFPSYTLVDTDSEWQFEDVVQIPKEDWSKMSMTNSGLSPHPNWFYKSLSIPFAKEDYLFEINYGLLDEVDVWFVDPSSGNVVVTYTAGDKLPFEFRPIQNEQFLFPIPRQYNKLDVYVRVDTLGPIKVPMRVWNKADYIEYSGAHKLFLGAFFGYMIAMALSNMFIFATTRNKTFAIYTGYVLSMAAVSATLHAVGFRLFWPDNVWFQERAIAFFACTTLILVIQFSLEILDLKRNSRRSYRILNAVKYTFILLFFASAVLPYEILLKAILLMMLATSPIILITGILLSINGNLIARYFTVAWAVLLLSGVIATLENLGIYQLTVDTSYLLMVGAMIETMLLALALAISFSSQFKETEIARAQAVESERQALKAKDELLEVQEQAQKDLEYSIEERTLELEIALRELSDANRELERLSAIDPLTGLMNRRYFDKRLLAELRRSRRERSPVAVAVLDIDFFKKVNDEYGHLAGDECLRLFALILQECIKRPSDVICRYGGEEFVAILPNTDLEGAERLMERVRLAIKNKEITFEENEFNITVSIGVTSRVIATDDEQDVIIAFADKLLYKAKQGGRDRVVAESY